MRNYSLRFFFALFSLALCLAVPAARSAMAQPPVDLPIPANDSDLDRVIATAARLQAQAAQCRQCKAGGGEAICAPAAGTAASADDLRVNLYGMQAPLQQAAEDVVGHMAQVQAEYDTLADHTDTQRRGLAWSKFLSDSAKITFDVISLKDSLSALQKAADFKTPPEDTDLQAMLGAWKRQDVLVETVNGAIGAANDLKAAHVDDQGFLSQTGSRLLTLEGGLSDLAGAVGNYQSAAKAWQTAEASAKAARNSLQYVNALKQADQAKAFARDMSKGLINALAKVGLEIAYISQANLADEIAANEKELGASDKVLQADLAQIGRIHQRQLKLRQALDAAREAAAAANGCAATCPGVAGLKPLPAAISSPGYGATLKAANAAVAALTGKLSSQSSAQLCREKPKEPAKTATGGAAKNICPNGGGLFGNIENVACQEQHAGSGH